MRKPQRRRAALCCGVVLGALSCAWLPACAASLTPNEAAQGWIQLFDGQSLFGWSAVNGSWNANGNVLVSDPEQHSRLRTTSSFSDFDLKFEARVSGETATLLLRADPQSKPAQPGCELSLTNGTIAGLEAGTATPVANAWNDFEVRAEGTQLTVSINGRVTASGKNPKNRVGYFEFNAPRGSRVEIRSILLKPLGLNPLYNGSNLDGWRALDAPAPQNKSKLKLPIPGFSGKPKAPRSVRWSGQGVIHGEGGVGELASSTAYDDFMLQFIAKAATARVGHAGVSLFFRETPNQFGSGYAVAAESSAGQENVPAAGSLVKLEKSRATTMTPGHFYTCTVIARAHRIAIWIDGSLVTDYYDSRPEGLYRAAAGPLGFRMQDEKASLDLREVTVASLPKGPEEPPPPPQVAAVAPSASAAPVPGSGGVPAPPPLIIQGQSPQEKAQHEQIRQLTVKALGATTADDAVQINKQILILDPGDMPAQQRLDKAQAQINAADAQRAHEKQEQQTSTATLEANNARKSLLVRQAEDELLRGELNTARDRLNDAKRLGASGPDVDRLQSQILSRFTSRLLLRMGLGGVGALALVATLMMLWRRRGKTMTAYLVALDGTDKGRRYLLNQEVTHIGGVAMDGSKKNEVLVRDPDRLVSRFHCEVHRRGNNCYLIDLDSSNGTYLRKCPLPPGVAAKLRDGDQFTLARAAAFELRIERSRAG